MISLSLAVSTNKPPNHSAVQKLTRANWSAIGLMVGADRRSQVLGVQTLRQRGRADKVHEHHGELAELGGVLRADQRKSRGWRRFQTRIGAQLGDGVEQLTAARQYLRQGPSSPLPASSGGPRRRSRSRGMPLHTVRGQGFAANRRAPWWHSNSARHHDHPGETNVSRPLPSNDRFGSKCEERDLL